MVEIDTIPITQNGMRDFVQVAEMAAYVRAGGIFDDACLSQNHVGEWARNRVQIARLEDGSEFFHDGHHRLLAAYLGGRDFLYPQEVEHFCVRYDQYHEVNFTTGWLTPCCVRTEVRVPNVHEFKRYVRSLPRDSAEAWVRSHRHLYCEPRNGLNTVADLARRLGFSRL